MAFRCLFLLVGYALLATSAHSQELLAAPTGSTKESRSKDLWRCLAVSQGQVGGQQSYTVLAIWDDLKKHVLKDRPTGGFVYTTALSNRTSPVANDDGYPTRRESLFGQSSNAISDRYVICLLASGYRWKDGLKPYPDEVRELADRGVAAAQAELAMLYRTPESGIGRIDHNEFASWLRKAAEGGYSPAQFNLSYAYLFGDGVARDDEEALRWMRRAAESGNTRAMPILQRADKVQQEIRTRLADTRDVESDQLAAEKGDASAQFRLATRYEDGEGVARSMDTAISWYRKSAEGGHILAQGYLGVIYEKGRGIKQDEVQAVRWYRMAADKGDAQSQYNLGVLHFYGHGVARNKEEARKWFERARDSNYPAAAGTLREFF